MSRLNEKYNYICMFLVVFLVAEYSDQVYGIPRQVVRMAWCLCSSDGRESNMTLQERLGFFKECQ